MSCQVSRILPIMLLLAILLKFIDSLRPNEQGDIHVAATTLLNTPKLARRQSEQQKHSVLSAIPPHPPKTKIHSRNQEFERQKKASIHHLTPHLLRHSIASCAEVSLTPSIQDSGHHYHTNYIQDKPSVFISDTIRESPATVPLRIKRNVTEMPPVTTSRSTHPTDEALLQRSTADNMFLCDHPPETFSSSFLGFPWEACLRYDRKWIQSITDTMKLCKSIYTLTESNPQKITVGHYNSDAGLLTVITHKTYVQSCLPLFRRFHNCEERESLTICWKEKVVFFHSYNCPHSLNDVYLPVFLLSNNTYCFQEFCEGWQGVVDGEVNGLIYRLTNTRHNLNTPSCGYVTRSLRHIYRQYNGTLYIIVNNNWPCCYTLYLVIWAGLPEAHGLNGAWSYLPLACQVGEVMLLVLVGCVMVGGIGGNLLVLLVMVSGGHLRQESSLLRTSLAFSDLLTATFVVLPAFIQHLTPFFSLPQYFTVTPDMHLTPVPVNVSSTIYLTNALHGWSGFPLFQSILFNITSTVSLLMLLVLSLERFVITGRYLRYKDYFNYCRIVLAITVAWITSLVNALWFAASEGGILSAQWLTFVKLPTGASGFGTGGARNFIYHGQFVVYLMLGISVVIFSALAIFNYVREQLHVAAEWRSLKMKASRKYSRDNRHVLTTMTLMLTLFLTSTIPLGVNITMNSIFYTFQQQTLFSYLSWWLFMAGSAWNPWVYNFRSSQFKEDIQKLQYQVRKACWQQRTHDDFLPPSQSFPSESLQLATRCR